MTTIETGPFSLLVGNKKGAFQLSTDGDRRDWSAEGPHSLGHIVDHLVLPGGGPDVEVPTAPGGRVVDFVHWSTPGHTSEPGVWYAGASPQPPRRFFVNGEQTRGLDTTLARTDEVHIFQRLSGG